MKSAKRSRIVLIGAALMVVAVVWILVQVSFHRHQQRTADKLRAFNAIHTDLDADRAAFHSKLLWNMPSPQKYDGVIVPPVGCEDVIYPSGDLRLHAWISKDPGDGKRHPAVIYLHGNWVFDPGNWKTTQAYRNAGFIVMTPMLRGENGNPGNVEMFWGELDDVVAAGKYAASLPFVDSRKVFVAGHSVGGTLAMLASMIRSPYAAAASFSGTPDQHQFAIEMPDWKVFDRSDPMEFQLRSPLDYAASIRCPLFMYAGDQESWCIPKTRLLESAARSFGKTCQFTIVPGDHLSSKPQEILQSLQKFQQLCATK